MLSIVSDPSLPPPSTPPGPSGPAPGPGPSGTRGSDVAVVLVSHNGARWLPTVIEGIAAQRVAPDRVVAVDTTSRDQSPELLTAAFGAPLTARGDTSYPAAVDLALRHLDEIGDGSEWIWLLHDDSTPDPDALGELLAATARNPEADILGPKLREWPSLRRLLEVGVTISGTGQRELGLERGEYDQGQHDEQRSVLAVNTAGMLVRRRVLDALGGFDEQLPIFGNDIDFGWRAAAAGHGCVVVPDAVVFHAEAAHRGLRSTPLTGKHTHYQERRAALFTLLVNASGPGLVFQTFRLAFGTLLRMIGFFLVRSPGEALDDLAALVSVYSKPSKIAAGRRRRKAERSANPVGPGKASEEERGRRVRSLLAPRWLPYRHGLDLVGDVFSAVTDQASDVAERRRIAAAELDPSSLAARRVSRSDLDDPDADEEAEADLDAQSALGRFVTNPISLLLTVFVIAALILARPAFGDFAGGALSPAPESGGSWWGLFGETWHELAQGTDVPAPGYVPVLALLSLIAGASGAVTVLLVLAVPFGLWGAWRFLRVAGRLIDPLGAPRWLLLIGAAGYALVPVASGAWGQGRLGLVVASALLPWLAHAALGFADPEPRRRWPAGWRTGLLLALTASFAPVAWFVVLALVVVTGAIGLAVNARAVRSRQVWGPMLVTLAVPAVLLLPWWLPALTSGGGAGLLLDTGRLPLPAVAGSDLLLGRLPDAGAPLWAGVVLLALAALALVPRSSRLAVAACWVIIAILAGTALLLSLVGIDLPSGVQPVGLGYPMILIQGAALTALVLGGIGFARAGVPAPVRWVFGLVAAVVPVVGLFQFATGEVRLGDDPGSVVPEYMSERVQHEPERGILVMTGVAEDGLDYRVLRGDGVRLGEDEILALTPEDSGLTDVITRLTSEPNPDVVAELADAGIEYLVYPGPVDPTIASGLDASGGLAQASASEAGTRAWRVTRELDGNALAAPDGLDTWVRPLLIAVSGVGLLVTLVLCAPTGERRRRRDDPADPAGPELPGAPGAPVAPGAQPAAPATANPGGRRIR